MLRLLFAISFCVSLGSLTAQADDRPVGCPEGERTVESVCSGGQKVVTTYCGVTPTGSTTKACHGNGAEPDPTTCPGPPGSCQ